MWTMEDRLSLRTRRSDGQRGGVLLLGAFILVAVFSFGLLVIDLARIELAAEGLQRTADAAALAGAEFLQRGGTIVPAPGNSSDSGRRSLEWAIAKRATLLSIRAGDNPIFGGSSTRDLFDLGTVPLRDECLGDPDLTVDPNLPCRVFDFGDIRVEIERGYGFREEPTGASPVYGDPRFVSLEGVYRPDGSGGLLWSTEPLAIPAQCAGDVADPLTAPMVEPTELANAVRVRLSLKSIPITMGALLRIFTGPAITREAVASVDLPVARGREVPTSAICQ